ncbi:MAG: carboxylesterase family protein, partial [Acidimicrobiales bacterium]|nr:carboxylesterase family protein [Acidimicrobiales bacterium]
MVGFSGGIDGGSTRTVRSAFLIVAFVMLGALLPATAVDAAVDAGTVVVSPDSGLVDGSVVTVSTIGATPATLVVTSLCPVGADPEIDGCDRWLSVEMTDETGSGSWQAVLDPILPQADGTVVDCRHVPCELVVSAWDTEDAAGAVVRVPVTFDPDGELLPPPIASVVPAVGLIDRQVVEVTGSGFVPADWVTIVQCHDLGNCRFLTEVESEADGTIDAEATVRASLPSYTDGPDQDCRSAAVRCRLLLQHQRGTITLDLQFDPMADLAPPPTVSVTPAQDLADGQEITVTGSGYAPGTEVEVSFCARGGPCDMSWGSWFMVDPSGAFTYTEAVYGDIVLQGSDPPDCRVDPWCEVRVRDWTDGTSVAAPVTFAAAPPRQRYADPVFEEVSVTRDILYRSTMTSAGEPIDLRLDIYEPVGDTAEVRPAIVFMFGGWFMFGNKDQLADLARDAARRGFVGVTIDYRIRPGMSFDQLIDAANDAYDDALAAIEWLKQNAEQYRIDPETIVATGYSAGGVLAYNLAYLPPERGPATSPVAAAIGMAGVPFAGPSAGDPPVLGLHAVDDEVLGIGPARDACAAAAGVGAVCEWVEYPTGGHLVILEQTRDFITRIYDFLVRNVLEPGGYMEPPVVDPPEEPEPPTVPPVDWPLPDWTPSPPTPSTSTSTVPATTTSTTTVAPSTTS